MGQAAVARIREGLPGAKKLKGRPSWGWRVRQTYFLVLARDVLLSGKPRLIDTCFAPRGLMCTTFYLPAPIHKLDRLRPWCPETTLKTDTSDSDIKRLLFVYCFGRMLCSDIGAGSWQVRAGAAVEGHEARHSVDQREGHDWRARARGNHRGADTVHPRPGEDLSFLLAFMFESWWRGK